MFVERMTIHETHVPAQPKKTEEQAWVQVQNGNQVWTHAVKAQARKGQEETDR